MSTAEILAMSSLPNDKKIPDSVDIKMKTLLHKRNAPETKTLLSKTEVTKTVG